MIESIPYPTLPKSRELKPKEKWLSIMWHIDVADAYGVDALNGLSLVLCRMIQASAFERMVLRAIQEERPCTNPSHLLWPDSTVITSDGKSMRDLLITSAERTEVDLKENIVFTDLWSRQNLMKNFQQIGVGRLKGSWKQDPNHRGDVWLPWPIVWIDNGNHSATVGIVRDGGKVRFPDVFDASLLLETVRTDGEIWYSVDTGKKIADITSQPMAGIFVIGQRLLARRNAAKP